MIIHKDFITYAEENGINLHYADDYKSWYDCWLNGYETGVSGEDYEPWIELGTEPKGDR